MLEKLSRVFLARLHACYLDNKAEVDRYFEDAKREFGAHGIPVEQENPALWERIQRARAKIGESHV